jgi:hypothetical protein
MTTSTSPHGAAGRRRRPLRLVPLLAAAFGVTALAWSASPASAAGTGSISGTVRNNAGVAVPGTHVVITELGRQAVTGADGTYSLTNVPFGTYDVRISNVCKNSLSALVTVDGAETSNRTFENRFNSDSFGHTCRPGAGFALLDDQNVLPLSGDDESVSVPLPFGFPFYGITKTAVNVSTNGYLTFGSDARANANRPADDAAAPSDSIFVFWDDLVVDASASVSTTTVGTAPNRVFMVEWRNVTFFGATGNRVTFQVQLFENGRINMGWRELDGSFLEQGASATIGLRNGVTGAGSTGLPASFAEPALLDGTKAEFLRNGVPVASAGVDQTVASGSSFTLNGSGSTDPDGTSGLSFQWVQIAGPASAIQDPKKAITSVAGQSGPKTLTYRLTVTDQFGRSNSDEVTVTVKSPK